MGREKSEWGQMGVISKVSMAGSMTGPRREGVGRGPGGGGDDDPVGPVVDDLLLAAPDVQVQQAGDGAAGDHYVVDSGVAALAPPA